MGWPHIGSTSKTSLTILVGNRLEHSWRTLLAQSLCFGHGKCIEVRGLSASLQLETKQPLPGSWGLPPQFSPHDRWVPICSFDKENLHLAVSELRALAGPRAWRRLFSCLLSASQGTHLLVIAVSVATATGSNLSAPGSSRTKRGRRQAPGQRGSRTFSRARRSTKLG